MKPRTVQPHALQESVDELRSIQSEIKKEITQKDKLKADNARLQKLLNERDQNEEGLNSKLESLTKELRDTRGLFEALQKEKSHQVYRANTKKIQEEKKEATVQDEEKIRALEEEIRRLNDQHLAYKKLKAEEEQAREEEKEHYRVLSEKISEEICLPPVPTPSWKYILAGLGVLTGLALMATGFGAMVGVPLLAVSSSSAAWALGLGTGVLGGASYYIDRKRKSDTVKHVQFVTLQRCLSGTKILVEKNIEIAAKLRGQEVMEHFKFSNGYDLSLMSINDERQIDEFILSNAREKKEPILIQKQDEYLVYGDAKGKGKWGFTKITSDVSDFKDLPFEKKRLERFDKKFTWSLINTLNEGHALLNDLPARSLAEYTLPSPPPTPWWKYALAGVGIVAGLAACATGIGALIGIPLLAGIGLNLGICLAAVGAGVVAGGSLYIDKKQEKDSTVQSIDAVESYVSTSFTPETVNLDEEYLRLVRQEEEERRQKEQAKLRKLELKESDALYGLQYPELPMQLPPSPTNTSSSSGSSSDDNPLSTGSTPIRARPSDTSLFKKRAQSRNKKVEPLPETPPPLEEKDVEKKSHSRVLRAHSS